MSSLVGFSFTFVQSIAPGQFISVSVLWSILLVWCCCFVYLCDQVLRGIVDVPNLVFLLDHFELLMSAILCSSPEGLLDLIHLGVMA